MKGYENSVKLSIVNNPSFFTDTMSLVAGTHTWRVDNSDNELWKIDTIPVVKEDGSTINSQYILSYDYLFGCVTIDTAQYPVTGTITVEGYKYTTLAEFTGCKTIGVSMATNILDTTSYANYSGGRSRTEGLKELSIDIVRNIEDIGSIESAYADKKEIIIEWIPSTDMGDTYGVWDDYTSVWDLCPDVWGESTPSIFRGIFVIDSLEESGSIDGIEEYSISLKQGHKLENENNTTLSVWTEYKTN